jgi:hypothetical protein
MLRRLFVVLLFGSAALTAAAWAISPEMAENWAFARHGTPESLLDARALLWLLRLAAPAAALACWFAWRGGPRTAAKLRAIRSDLIALMPATPSNPRLRRGVVLAAVTAWLLLAASHWIDGARRVLHEWPVYGWRSGAQVLPNMSESNRAVIRYLQATTPENARILVASDQTLYFLSYYLWPRQVFQRRHPDSEFTVPQPDQARQLAAYRLSDLTADDIASINPDFVLEYYEGPAYVDPDRLLDDTQWITFVRQLRDDRLYVPPYNVRLRPISELGSRP